MLLCGGMGAAMLSAEEVTNAQLLEQFRAMRAAYESRISALEEALHTMKTEQAEGQRVTRIQQGIEKALGQAPVYTHAFKGGNAVRAASRVSLGGYTEFQYVDRGDKVSSFDQLRTVLEIGAQLHENIKLYIELENEHGGTIEGGGGKEGELELEQAWMDFRLFDQAIFRAGTVLVPVGRYNLYHEGWINNFVDRPLVSRRITPTTWFSEGIGFHGQALDKDFLGISYEAYLLNPGRADRITPEDGFRGLRLENDRPIFDSKKAGAFRVAFEPARKAKWLADYLEIGFSGYFTSFSGFRSPGGAKLNDGEVHIYSTDLTFERGHFGFRGEAALAKAGRNRNADTGSQTGLGWYAEAYYKFWPNFLNNTPFGKPNYKHPELVTALRWGGVDLATDNFDQRDLRRWTFGLSYRPLPRVVFKFDYQVDHSPSGNDATTLSESGTGKNSDAFLFGVAVGF